MSTSYDSIGINYSKLRRPDPRIADAIGDALGPARSVLNVGAGTGSYEPADLVVTAVEPSAEMIRQRTSPAAEIVRATADLLPFADASFDAAMAILTVHHWPDKEAGLRELRRVTRGPIVILTFDPAQRPWLTDYLPALAALDEQRFPVMAEYSRWLENVRAEAVPIPADCVDGFLHAYWRRPEAYFDPHVRSGNSSFWSIDDVESGLQVLRRDLDTGEWRRRYGHLLRRDTYDAGYRLIVAERAVDDR